MVTTYHCWFMLKDHLSAPGTAQGYFAETLFALLSFWHVVHLHRTLAIIKSSCISTRSAARRCVACTDTAHALHRMRLVSAFTMGLAPCCSPVTGLEFIRRFLDAGAAAAAVLLSAPTCIATGPPWLQLPECCSSELVVSIEGTGGSTGICIRRTQRQCSVALAVHYLTEPRC